MRITSARAICVTAALLVATMPTANATVQFPSTTLNYSGQDRSWGDASAAWTNSRPYLTVQYRDLKKGDWYTHADGYIYAYMPHRNPVSGLTFYQWDQIKHEKFVNIDYKPNPITKGTSAGTKSGARGYGSRYQVCLKIDWKPDPCKGQALRQY